MGVELDRKPTEVGLLPKDWDTARLGDLFEITSSKRVFQSDWKTVGIPFYRARELAQLGKSGSVDNELFISEDLYEDFKRNFGVPEIGDMLVTGVGTIGKAYVVPNNSPFYFKDGNIIWFKIGGKVSPGFLRQLFLTRTIQRQVEDGSAGTTVGTYTITAAQKTLIPLPNLSEQQAIATALSDADALIESMEKLIAKKRMIKQGAMQELLTGKRRLPGFRGRWPLKTLGDLFTFNGGVTASREQLSQEGLCYLHYGDIHTSKKNFIDVHTEYQEIPKLNVSENQVPEGSMLMDGDVVFVDASEDDEGTSKHVVIRNPESIPFISGLHTIVAKSRTKEVANTFREHCFQTSHVKDQFRFFAVGTKVSGISKKNIAKILVPLPPIEEQIQIAEILSNIEAEIAHLQKKSDKMQNIKRGMMQELLTGRIRLV